MQVFITFIFIMFIIYLTNNQKDEEDYYTYKRTKPNRKERRNRKFNKKKDTLLSRLLNDIELGEPIKKDKNWNKYIYKPKVKNNYKKYVKSYKNNKIRSKL